MRNQFTSWEGFEHSAPLAEQELSRDEFGALSLDELQNPGKNTVWSISSKVCMYGGGAKHIPMMNFHLENGAGVDIRRTLEHICGSNTGVLLDSGRYKHYYGDFMLDNDAWTRFMAEFLMPTTIVSPRYIGHRLRDGYCTLRLTADGQYKPKVPEVVEIL